jgi:hypothetical protein
MVQALVEGLKAVEAVIEEIGGIAGRGDENEGESGQKQRIEIE